MYLASGNSVRQQHPLELAFKINTFKSMPTYRQVTRVCFIDNIGPESCIQTSKGAKKAASKAKAQQSTGTKRKSRRREGVVYAIPRF